MARLIVSVFCLVAAGCSSPSGAADLLRDASPSESAPIADVASPLPDSTPSDLSADAAAPEVLLRWMTYNIAFGSKSDLASVAALVEAAAPDIICLQEVDRFQPRSGSVDQVAALGALLPSLPHHAFVVAATDPPAEVVNAVFSRWPIVDTVELPFVAHRPGSQPRAALFATVEAGAASSVTAICTHLNGGDKVEANDERIDHLKEIEARGKIPHSVLLGDFNHTPERASYLYSLQNWVDVQAEMVPPEPPVGGFTIGTYPSGDKRDFVYLRDAADWTIREVIIIDDLVTSDHRPVYADLAYLSR